MKKRDIRFASIPSTEEVAAERERLAYQSRYQRVLRSTIYILVVVAAVAVLLATLFLPVLQVSGDSMNPTLNDKDIILLVKSNHIENGELCGFYWQNKLLLKRIIGQPGDVIDMDVNGVVSVNGVAPGRTRCPKSFTPWFPRLKISVKNERKKREKQPMNT